MFSLYQLLSLALIAIQASLVYADISISSPVAGASFVGSGAILAKWTDDGIQPAFSKIATLTIMLCTGSNSAVNCFYKALSAQSLTALNGQYSISLAPAAALAGNGKFFLQFYAATSNGGFTIHYSDRFSLTGMTGPLAATDGGNTAPPSNQISYSEAGPSSSISMMDPLSGATIPFSLQTGIVRYAPMQMQPATKVTHALSASRRFPMSSVTYFATYTMKPLQITTATPSITYSKSQYINWAPVAENPTVAGYYAASEALSRTINAKARRGYVDL